MSDLGLKRKITQDLRLETQNFARSRLKNAKLCKSTPRNAK